MVASRTVENCIMRISQMKSNCSGRYSMIVATRDVTNIITGVIKANNSFHVFNFCGFMQIDSRYYSSLPVLKTNTGKGDMLFHQWTLHLL